MHCDPELDKLMQIVLREADRLSSLVTNFLLFAKPPAGRVEPLELGKALAETVTLFEKDRNCRGRIEIATEFCSGIWIKMDPVHLRQIFWNLLLNAAEAIETMGRIDVKMYPLKNKYACVHIADTGCGISEEIVQSIFDPFFTTKPNGTGLGLSIVHRILEYYGSRLDLETRLNVGTTFMMKLKRIGMPTLS
jgi:two-component system sensor histidine kinase PilS (NtrC family)